MKSRFFVVCVCLFLASCASSPVSIQDATIAPASNIYAPEAFVASPSKAQVVLVRDSGVGGKCALGVYLDGKLVGAIERKQKLVMYVTPGAHILGAGPNPNGGGVCNWFSDSLRREVSVNATTSHVSQFRLAMLKGEVSIMPTAFK